MLGKVIRKNLLQYPKLFLKPYINLFKYYYFSQSGIGAIVFFFKLTTGCLPVLQLLVNHYNPLLKI